MSRHLSTLVLHRYRYGELSADEARAVRAHLDTCERCAARFAVQQRTRAAFVVRPVPEAILQAAQPPWWQRWQLPRLGWATALVAALSLFVVVPALRDLPAPTEDIVRAKGDLPHVEVWVSRAEGPRPLRDDEVLRAGDVIQLKVHPRGHGHVGLAGRDGRGVVEVYGTWVPAENALQPAPFALTLDAAPGPQQLFFFASDDPIGAEAARAAIEHGGEDDGLQVVVVEVPKE